MPAFSEYSACQLRSAKYNSRNLRRRISTRDAPKFFLRCGLVFLGREFFAGWTQWLRRSWSCQESESAYIAKYEKAHESSSPAIDQHILRTPRAVGNECLMELIAGGNDHSAQDCERGPGEELGAWKHQTPRAQPGQSDQAESDEVAGFANGKYKPVPLNVANRSESSIPDREQQCAGAISAKTRV